MLNRQYGTRDGKYGANGKYEEPAGLLNEGFRYRDRQTNTFITRDPAGFIDGPNDYNYVGHNPWSAWDPNGLATVLIPQTTGDIGYVSPTNTQNPGIATSSSNFDSWSYSQYNKSDRELLIERWGLSQVEDYEQNFAPAREFEHGIRDAQKAFFDSYMVELGRPPFPAEEAIFTQSLAKTSDQNGYKRIGAELWSQHRELLKQERQGVYRTAAFDVLTNLVMMAADGPLPFGDSAAAKRTLSMAAEDTGSFVANRTTVVIGENMAGRLVPYAEARGYQTINDWLKSTGRTWDESANTDWVNWVQQQGYDIVDIGPDFTRRLDYVIDPTLPNARPPSAIYGSERMELLEYWNYQKVFDRTGKYSGGVPGFDH
jgi:RHS repeat-associated protein